MSNVKRHSFLRHIQMTLWGAAIACCSIYAAEFTEKQPVHTLLGPPEPAVERAAIKTRRTIKERVLLEPQETRSTQDIEPRATPRIEKTSARLHTRENEEKERDSTDATDVETQSAVLSVPRVNSRGRDTFVDKDKDGYDDTRTEVHDL